MMVFRLKFLMNKIYKKNKFRKENIIVISWWYIKFFKFLSLNRIFIMVNRDFRIKKFYRDLFWND